MPITIIGPTPASVAVQSADAVIVETKQFWSLPWRPAPELQLVRAVAAVSGQGLGSCELKRPYGKAKAPHDADLGMKVQEDLAGYWVRLRLLSAQGNQIVWIGRISNETRNIHMPNLTLQSGVQTWVAYEPLHLLQRIHVGRSIWLDNESQKDIGWVPDMNARDSRRLLVGNRSATKSGGTYLYGGTATWSRFDYAEYILKWFVDESGFNGASWTLAGQANILKNIKDNVRFGATQTVASILRELIPNRQGLDFTIIPTDSGFLVYVFAMSAVATGYLGTVLPNNPRNVVVNRSQATDMLTVKVVRSRDQQYGQIRVRGKRIVVCCSLRGAKAAAKANLNTSLESKWPAATEAAYDAGTGTPADLSDKHDKARRSEEFDLVYQSYGAPVNWDHNGGGAAPFVALDGIVKRNVAAPFQSTVRETLTWLPLQKGFDYTTDPPIDNNPAGHEGSRLRPSAWLFEPADALEDTTDRYVSAAESAISVMIPDNEWGVSLAANPNHLLALSHFAGAADTDILPKYDYEEMIATIAFESDQRLELGIDLNLLYPFLSIPIISPPSSGILNIDDPDAEFWYLAPNTIVGTDADGNLKGSGGVGRVLRNDTPRIALTVAGAIARYFNERARAEITIKGYRAFYGLLGAILTVIEDQGVTFTIQAPITQVEIIGGDQPQTIVRTGSVQ